MSTWRVDHGDCLDLLRAMPDCSVDACVTDAPYGLSFMGKKWDYDVPSVEVWAECLRVLKPGGHLLAFAGTRTQHRMAVRIEDAGFEIRDMIAWVYSTGFPKSHNISKAIDKAVGAEREIVATIRKTPSAASENMNEGWRRPWAENAPKTMDITAPATPAARQWQGWGTALKPAWESLTLATKPTTDDTELAIILSSLSRLEDQLCQLSSASAASPTSGSSQSASVVACGTAPCGADERINTSDGSPARTGTSSCELAIRTSLNTVRSWKRTLAECLHQMSTSTIATESGTTTDWRTLRFSLSQITPDTIIRASSHPDGLGASADTAVAHFNASLALLQATRTLSATGPAMSLDAAACPDVAVRPNLDPCIMARKPFPGTVAANVMQHGTGAVNIEGCRVPGTDHAAAWDRPVSTNIGAGSYISDGTQHTIDISTNKPSGRWPANLIHDGSDEVLAGFPETKSGKMMPTRTTAGVDGRNAYGADAAGGFTTMETYGDSGSAARFFYCPKASKADREAGCDELEERAAIGGMKANGLCRKCGRQRVNTSGECQCTEPDFGPIARQRTNPHPTVKPTALMQYLCRLVTPPGGTVLDPFTGSGSTGKAAMLEGFNFIGFEREAEYVEIARRRIAEAANVLGGPVCVA
jgi:DNA modification methylase